MHQLLEGFAELGIEDGVDDRVHETVDVAQPGGEDEGGDPGLALPPQFGTHGVHNIAREEGHPAKEEDTCKEDRIKDMFILVMTAQYDKDGINEREERNMNGYERLSIG